MYLSSSTASITRTSFTFCTAVSYYYNVFTYGGAIYLDASTATLIDLALQGNVASSTTGARDIHNDDSTLTCGTSCEAGQYHDCQDIADTSESDYYCYVNCGSCTNCSKGTSSSVASSGSASCEPCAPGYAADSTGAASCTSCEEGRYATDDTNHYGIVTLATSCNTVGSGRTHSP